MACRQCPHGAGESEIKKKSTNDMLKAKQKGLKDRVFRFSKQKHRLLSYILIFEKPQMSFSVSTPHEIFGTDLCYEEVIDSSSEIQINWTFCIFLFFWQPVRKNTGESSLLLPETTEKSRASSESRELFSGPSAHPSRLTSYQ